MPAGRPNRPLFDLIAEETADGRKRAATTPVSESPAVEIKPPQRIPDPEDEPRSSTPVRGLPHMPPSSVGSRTNPKGLLGSLLSSGRAMVELTTPWVAASVAIGLAILLGIWIIAYKMGETEATQRLAGGPSAAPPKSGTSNVGTSGSKPTGNSTGAVTGNQPSTGTSTPGVTGQPPATDDETDGAAPSPALADETPATLPRPNATEAGPVVAFNGSYDADPRVPGNNYLVLASSMSRQDVKDAVDFLGRSGFTALGVPYGAVDRTGRDDKNDPLYKLVYAQGFNGSDMKETQSRRDKILEEARRLGLIYQRQHRGKYNFAKPNWEKYVR